MNHSLALSKLDDLPPPLCQGSLTFVTNSFFSDVEWRIYECDECEARICAVGGGIHNWNFVSDQSTHDCEHREVKFRSRFLGKSIYYCLQCGDMVQEA